MTPHPASNTEAAKPFTTAATLDATEPMNDNITPFAPTEDEIADRAYLKFQNQGASDGHDLTHWLAAETELIAEHALVGT
ncbi:DUF2934 domain-containing protein [Prosthecobacter sp.]|uniref:DUF2934 domain-containing protein n=1 Tax=Prosthecobacter sp. TaxID=1965333 RepID=UPI002ABB5FFE|nr:DUF2934 domain-containing protein [Prosthecobacter sp.]MDZ4403586.1 DUF2934 domain-containing protein [Prosthecobacter sp.]